jgi:hypothetical protein
MKTLLHTAAPCGPQADAVVSGRGVGQLLARRNSHERARLAAAWKRGDFDIERTTKHASMIFGVSGSLIRQAEERRERMKRAKQSAAANDNGKSNGNGKSDGNDSATDNVRQYSGDPASVCAQAYLDATEEGRAEIGQRIGTRRLWDESVAPNLR